MQSFLLPRFAASLLTYIFGNYGRLESRPAVCYFPTYRNLCPPTPTGPTSLAEFVFRSRLREEIMKNSILVALVLVASVAMAQESTPPQQSERKFSTNLVNETAESPSYSDLYCSGFISNENVSLSNQITGGRSTPNETLYSKGNTIFATGSGYQEGSRYSVIRQLRDPNRMEPFKGQRAAIVATGQPYAQLGRVRIVGMRGDTAIAEVEFSCQPMTVGDILVPFQEHPPVEFRKDVSMENFPAGSGKLAARIVMAYEFDFAVGRGQKVYLDAGANKGVKVGDYFRAVRGYDPAKLDPVESLSYRSPVGDDTQKVPGKVSPAISAKLPVRTLGEMVVLTVTPTSSTAMITDSLEAIQVGDQVELLGNQ